MRCNLFPVGLVFLTNYCFELQTVSENTRLEGNSGCNTGSGAGGSAAAVIHTNNVPDDDFDLWDQSGFMLRNDADDSVTNAKLVTFLCLAMIYK